MALEESQRTQMTLASPSKLLLSVLVSPSEAASAVTVQYQTQHQNATHSNTSLPQPYKVQMRGQA